MINDTFALFRIPFDKANINRDEALDCNSLCSAVCARVQYLSQLVASVVSIPFLILAGLFDLLRGEGHLLDIPIALFSELFIVLPLSVLGAIFPMSWNRDIDLSLANYTKEAQIDRLMNNCLPFLEIQLDVQKGIELEDVKIAIKKKKNILKKIALTTDLEQLKRDILRAPLYSIEQADLYETLKIKETTFDELDIDSLQLKDSLEIRARRRAGTQESIEELRVQEGDPEIKARAILKKYVATYTYDGLRLLLQAAPPETRAEIEAAIRDKETTIMLLALGESMETLNNPPPNDRISLDLYQHACYQKQIQEQQSHS